MVDAARDERPTQESIGRRLADDGVTYMLAQWVDIHGTPRCKGVPVRALDQFLGGSAGFAGAATVGMGQGPHDHDLVGMPDLATYTLVPWETGLARFACDIQVDGEPWPYCSRTALRRQIERLGKVGYSMKVGVEPEHMLVTRASDGSIAPFDPSGFDTLQKPCYDFKSFVANLEYLRTLVGYLEELGWEPYAADHEDATAQFEINWKYADALETADRYTFFKMMTSQVAQRFGAIATHMPKPFPHLTGNGSHFHFSLWDGDTNVFLDESDPRGLGQSELAYHFLGGLLAHIPALSALIAPTVNCYKRLSIGAYLTGARSGFTWTPAFITYGDNNRTQMFRTPEPGRFECRVVSGAVNPYLGIAGFIAAGIDGIERGLDPGDPQIGRNMYDTPLEEARREGLRILPQSLPEALDELERDEVVLGALGPELAAEFLRIKRTEWVHYHNDVSRWEVDQYLTLF
jgi:glutamine synthetase